LICRRCSSTAENCFKKLTDELTKNLKNVRVTKIAGHCDEFKVYCDEAKFFSKNDESDDFPDENVKK
jgi:hypothetical protein